jgi:Fe-S oxidoreductase
MNPGKLEDPEIIDKVFTPSFNLLELEARILKHNSLETLASMISKCVRCGKCKADCCVFYPGANLFYHPRNKNLAIGSLIEALLYDMQRSHFPRFNQLKNLEEIADHCTLCGKCLKPCPVDIDTAQVSILEREILGDRGYKHTPLPTRMSLHYLKTRNRAYNRVFRKTVVEWGAAAQRLGHAMLRRVPDALVASRCRVAALLRSPMIQPPRRTLRSTLPKTGLNEALLLHPPEVSGRTVFYFPGCGSERLYSDIALASIHTLLTTGTRVVLPPAHLCCGFPAKANGKRKMQGDVTLRDTIILSQIREMLGYIHFDAVVVSCGTCREALHGLGVEEIFGCSLADVSAFVLDSAPDRFRQEADKRLFYHAPCHDSLQGEGVQMARRLGGKVVDVPACCSEAGTLALSRPDITGAMRERKREALQANDTGQPGGDLLVTNCPSCLSGLGRNPDLGFVPRHLATLLAEQLGGERWRKELTEMLKTAEVVAF